MQNQTMKKTYSSNSLLNNTKDNCFIRNKKEVAKNQDKINMANSLFGVLPQNLTLEEAKKERLKNYDCINNKFKHK